MKSMDDLQNHHVIGRFFLLDAKVDATASEGVGVGGTGLVFQDYVPSYHLDIGADLVFAVDATETDVAAVARDGHKAVLIDGWQKGRWRPGT